MSSVSTRQHLPIWSSDIAEHSRCQPGRPRPNGASQAAPTCSSIGSARFHSAKSRGSSLAYSSLATRAPILISRRSSCDRRPYVGNLAIAKYTDRKSVVRERVEGVQEEEYR